MGLFGGIKGAKYSEGGVYLLDGVYRLEIQSCKTINTRNKGPAFVSEFKVLESSNPARTVGMSCSWMVMLTGNQAETALGNIKQFLENALPGLDFSKLTDDEGEAAVDTIVSEGNPMKGKLVRCTATTIKTKKNTDFTKVKYMPDSSSATEMAKAKAEQQ